MEERGVLKVRLKNVIPDKYHLARLRDGVKRCHQVVEVAYAFAKKLLLQRFEDSLAGRAFDADAALRFSRGLKLNDDLFGDMLSVVTIRDLKRKQGRPYTVEKKQMMEDYLAKYNEWAARGELPTTKPSAANLSFALHYETTGMATAYKNNVFCHFLRYIKAFVRMRLDTEAPPGSRPKAADVAAVADAVLGVVRKKPLAAHLQVLADELRPLLVPADLCKRSDENKQSWRYETKVHPERFVPYMVYIARTLEANERRTYSPLPMRTTFIPCHMTLDTQGLLDLLVKDQDTVEQLKWQLEVTPIEPTSETTFDLPGLQTKRDVFKAFKEVSTAAQARLVAPHVYRSAIWTTLTKMGTSKHAPLESDGKVFNNMIETDGYAVSIHYCVEALKGTTRYDSQRPKQDKKQQQKGEVACKGKGKGDEFGYVQHLSTGGRQALLADHSTGQANLVAADPGKGNILTLCGRGRQGEARVVRYSYAQRRVESYLKRNKQERVRILNRPSTRGDAASPSYHALSSRLGGDEASSRSCWPERFGNYLRNRWDEATGGILRALYTGADMFRAHRLRAFLGKRSSEDRLISRIKEAFGDKVVILWGDWGRNPNLRHQPPSPGIGLRRKVHSLIRTYSVHESYTSSVCPKCEGHGLDKPLSRTFTRPRRHTGEWETVAKPIHHLLRCQNADCGCWWNRDTLGALNIHKQAMHWLMHGRGAACFERPEESG